MYLKMVQSKKTLSEFDHIEEMKKISIILMEHDDLG
jgi:hypothetical protein